MRKCTFTECREEIPGKVDSDRWQNMGFCNVDCMAKHGLKKAREQAERRRKKDNAEFKKQIVDNDISKQLKLTQGKFNQWIKLECYKDRPWCVSCRKPATLFNLGDFCAGHFKTVGSSQELRFNTKNVNLQCNRYCNMGLSGNINGNKTTVGYKKGLEIDLGSIEYEALMLFLDKPHKNYTRDCKQLKIVRAWCSGRIKVLKKELEII
jgi:hypothetical protein